MRRTALAVAALLSAATAAAVEVGSLPEWIQAEVDHSLRAEATLQLECERGKADACAELGFRLLTDAWREDEVRAAETARRACTLGAGSGCALAGYLGPAGQQTAWYERGCELEYAPACHELALALRAAGRADDAGKAFTRGCRLGYRPACERRGEVRRAKEDDPGEADDGDDDGDQVPQPPAWLAKLSRLTAEFGPAPAKLASACTAGGYTTAPGYPCAQLALLHLSGRGVPRKIDRAADLARRACRAGNPEGCAVLGWLAEVGGGLDAPDPKLARESYDKACHAPAAPVTAACAALSRMGSGPGAAAEPADDAPERNGDAGPGMDRVDCDRGRAVACTRLGDRAAHGRGVRLSFRDAAGHWLKACERARGADPVACARLGVLFAEGNGVARDPARARRYLERGCKAQVEGACAKLEKLEQPEDASVDAWCGEGEEGCRRSDAESRSAAELDARCADGKAAACVQLGRWLAARDTGHRDMGRAARVFQQACDADASEACTELAYLYFTGEGVAARDLAETARLDERACTLGLPHGCANFGRALANGDGVPKDPERALRLAARACDDGCMHGCPVAAYLILADKVAGRDARRAVKLLERGCEGDEYTACGLLALAILRGDGTEMDRARASRLARRSCDHDTPQGCFALGLVFEAGDESDDPARAREAFRKACNLGSQASCTRIGKTAGAEESDP